MDQIVLSDEQLEAIQKIKEFLSSDETAFSLVGSAGTGKTLIMNKLVNDLKGVITVQLCAPTHKAKLVLQRSTGRECTTLHSLLALTPNLDIFELDFNELIFRSNSENVTIPRNGLVICDEASMINKGLVKFVEKVCKTNKCKIIYIGDESQLPPVNELYSSAFKNVKLSRLTQIVRQGDDNPVSHLLELLRYDIKNKSFEFLNYISKNTCKFNDDCTKGYKVCSTSEFNDLVYVNFSDEELTRNIDFAKIIAYTNSAVASWNKLVRNLIIKDAHKSVITKNDLLISYCTIVNKFNECVIKNSEEYILKDVVNYVHPTYRLKGFMVRFTSIHGGIDTSPLFILDHKDAFTINMYVKISRELIEKAKYSPVKLRAQAWKEYYNFKESCLLLVNVFNPTTNNIEFSRDVDYGFSLTSHKSQGSTFDTVLVDVNDMVFDKLGHPYTNAEEINRRLYVACSRCKNKLYLKYGK